MKTFDDILEIEKDGSILKHSLSFLDIPLYFIVRSYLIQEIINVEFSLTDYSPKKKRSLFKYFLFALRSFFSNLFLMPKKKIIFFCSDIVFAENKSKTKSRLYDEFILCEPEESGLIIRSNNYKIFKNYSAPIFYSSLLNIILKFSSKAIKVNSNDRKNIESFMQELKRRSIFTSNDFYTKTENMLISSARRFKVLYYTYQLFFKIKKPKLVFIEDGHYMGDLIPLTIAAKASGVVVAEYQHGYIGPAHRAYNYSETIHDKVKNYLPDYFLTFGDYWSKRISTPSKIFSIGNPELLKNVSSSKTTKHKLEKKQILFISGGTRSESLVHLMSQLTPKLMDQGLEIYLRPHPLEFEDSDNRYAKIKSLGVKIDNENLFERLNKTKAIISLEVSTVLYEALMFTDEIFIEDTDYVRYYEKESPFIFFSNHSELLDALSNNCKISGNLNKFWESDFRNRYKMFLSLMFK